MIIKLEGKNSTLNLNFEYNFPNDNLKIGLLGFYSSTLVPNLKGGEDKSYGNLHLPKGKSATLTSSIIEDKKYNDITNIFNFSNNNVNKYPIETINIHCNLANGMIVSNSNIHKETNIISSFNFVNSQIKQRINYEPKNPIYFPIQQKSLNKIEIQICDENNDLINFEEVNIIIILEIK